MVNKNEVLDKVWPGTFVGDAVLKDIVRQLREALHDDPKSPAYIETAHRRGYRFIGELYEPEPIESGSPAQQPPVPQLALPVAGIDRSRAAIQILGREVELARLRRGLESALAGKRQTIFITGEPGIGKTTVVRAFLQEAAQTPGILVAQGQCLEHYGAGEAYLPVLDGFSRLCRTRNGAPVMTLLRQQAPTWLAQMPSLLLQAERENLQSQVSGSTRERMLREMAEAIESLTSQSPLLLVLEDLHWSDYSTLDLVSYLARRQDSARLMVIGTYRPVDVIVNDHALKGVKRELQAHGLCEELSLEYLSEETVNKYLNARFPDHSFPIRLQRTICRRTGGNPLFMVNLVEYLSEQKLVEEKNGSWELQAEVSEVEREVPANLRQLIEQQIEKLSPDERTVLEAASVAGVECSSLAMAAGLDKPTEWVEHHCEELARRHRFLSPSWLVELPDGTVTSRHRFIHVLYREVPYQLISPMRRSQIHHRIGERQIEIYGDRASDIAAELAMHFEQSHDWPRALEYLLQAAENAAARSAHHEATDLVNRALEALKFLSETPEQAKQEMKLRMILSASLTATKGFASPEVERINARGRELFWRHGPSSELFYMLWSLNMYRQFSGEMHASLEMTYQLMQLAQELKDTTLIVIAHCAIGSILVLLERCTEALEHNGKGTALYDTDGNCRNVFISFDSKVMFECFAGMALLALGYPDKSAQKVAAGLLLARQIGHPQTLVVAEHIAAQLHHLRGEPHLVYERAKEALDLADEHGFPVWRAFGLMELGWAVAELGRSEEGIGMMQRGLAEYEATGAKLRSPYCLGMLADQLCKAGRIEEGLQTITKALKISEEIGERYALAELYRIKGELLLSGSDLPSADTPGIDRTGVPIVSQARACFDTAIATAKQQGARWWQLRAALAMDRLALRDGDPAHTQLAEVYCQFTEGYDTGDLKEAKTRLSDNPISAAVSIQSQ